MGIVKPDILRIPDLTVQTDDTLRLVRPVVRTLLHPDGDK